MTRSHYRLALALLCSLLAHLAPALPDLSPAPRPVSRPPPLLATLQTTLQTPPAPAPETVALELPEPAASAPAPQRQRTKPQKTKPPPPQAADAGWQGAIRRQFAEQQQRGEFYPPEAIALGLQGDVLVLLLLAPDGSVSAARVEQSSGQRLLDDAALRAVRALRSLPADAPRETLLPVRFRLR
ncbi:MAG: TonB family protein [Azonexus sp.]|jgi:protein TonB|nr:TonB family protein [Azonexus sp.]